MTNLLLLPQIPAGTTITIDHNVDWNDQLFVSQPGFTSSSISVTGTLDGTTGNITNVTSTVGIIPGMLAVGFGIPIGTTVSSVTSDSFVLSNNTTLAATATVTLFPAPLDLTGITFTSKLRVSATSNTVLLVASTTNGFMTNGGMTGVFGWNIPAANLPNWPAPVQGQGTLSTVIDIQATDATGALVNMCAANGPIPLTVNLAVTR
jgi:hypothetical protein